MALILNQNLSTGYSANYFIINFIQIDVLNSIMNISLNLYKDGPSAQSGIGVVSGASYSLTGADFTTVFSAPNLLTAIYAYLQGLTDFKGATTTPDVVGALAATPANIQVQGA